MKRSIQKQLLYSGWILLVGWALSVEASPKRLFDVSRLETPQALQLLNQDECQPVIFENTPVLAIHPGTDPYHEKSWDFQRRESLSPFGSPFVLEVEFFDQGAGIIDVQVLSDDRFHGTWVQASRKGSYTRLNTHTYRSAFFQFNLANIPWQNTTKPHFKITGLQYLRRITLHPSLDDQAWQQIKDTVPVDVQPMVHLEHPLDIVCSAGVTVLAGKDALRASLDALHELAPLAKVLGFNAIESYVKWNLIEPKLGRFDFSFYDAVVDKIRQYDLQWFPLLIVGSAYALPDWFVQSDENIGFVCLEHNLSNPIQSIWSPYHKKHVTRVLQAFGKHYEPMHVLRGVRLGPTGNYGESQYPAGGNWGYKGQPMHIHIGYWANDPYAHRDFQQYLKNKYASIQKLNQAWDKSYASFDEIHTVLPQLCYSKMRRLDMARWYTRSMSEWCEWWALEARKAMPHTPIYQSAGGWGFLEAGTDYVDQAKSMVAIQGGIRLTNETDSFQQNFFATRLAATAARLYGIDLGFEPASSHTARGTVGRMFNTITTNGDHFFTYHPNLLNRQLAIQKWIDHFSLFDTRQDPVIDVAVYYPETMNQLDEGTFRHLYAWGFNPRAREIRKHIEVDYLNETLMRDGFLDRYKVLVFVWGNIIDDDVQQIIDTWIRNGGVALYPSFPKGDQETLEGDRTRFRRWSKGDTGQGRFIRYPGDMEPPDLYGEFVNEILLTLTNLHPWTQKVLRIQHPPKVFFSIQKDGHLLALNYSSHPALIRIPGSSKVTINPYTMIRLPL